MNQFAKKYMATLLWQKLRPETAKCHCNAYISFMQCIFWIKLAEPCGAASGLVSI
jgi:hypothetical protein